MTTPLLDTLDTPADLRALSPDQLPKLAAELREFLVASVAQTGGHLASNLGTVELTLALHYVFDTPRDRIVWDVGHQTYAHKILTGRRAAMAKLRQGGGIAGFRAVPKANMTRLAWAIPAPRFRPRSAWPRPSVNWVPTSARWPSSATAR
jgi:deoxyxylulose-5-phosphate synthase